MVYRPCGVSLESVLVRHARPPMDMDERARLQTPVKTVPDSTPRVKTATRRNCIMMKVSDRVTDGTGGTISAQERATPSIKHGK